MGLVLAFFKLRFLETFLYPVWL